MAEAAYVYYVLFRNHTEGLKLFQDLRARHVAARISPTPRAASASCGISLLVEPSAIEQVRQCIAETQDTFDRIVRLPVQINPNRDKYC